MLKSLSINNYLMKINMVAIVLFSSIVSNAQIEGYDLVPEDYNVVYISICEQNKVVSYDDNNNSIIKADCSKENQTCKTISRRTTVGTYYYGVCK